MALTIQQSPVLTEMLPPHEEVLQPREQFDENGFEAVRRLKCAWSDRFALCGMLLGQTWGQTGSPGNETVVVQLPHQYPDYPQASCRAAVVDQFGDRIQAADQLMRIAKFDHAIVTATYRTPALSEGDPQDAETVLLTERLEPSVEFITAPAGNLTWEPNGEPITDVEAPGIPVRMLDYTVSVTGLASFDPQAVLQCGVCNALPVYAKTLGVTFPAETLLYHGFFPQRTWTTAGAQLWSGEFRFTYKPAGWNKFWRAGNPQAQPLYSGGSPFKPVPPVNILAFLP